MVHRTVDEFLDFVRCRRDDVGESGCLRGRIEHVDAGGAGTTARFDDDPARVAGHEVDDVRRVAHRREDRNEKPCGLRHFLHQDLVAVTGGRSGVQAGQAEFAAQCGGPLHIDLGQGDDRFRPVPSGEFPSGAQHRVVVVIVGDRDDLGESLTRIRSLGADRHQPSALLRQPLGEGQPGGTRADQYENHREASFLVTANPSKVVSSVAKTSAVRASSGIPAPVVRARGRVADRPGPPPASQWRASPRGRCRGDPPARP